MYLNVPIYKLLYIIYKNYGHCYDTNNSKGIVGDSMGRIMSSCVRVIVIRTQ